MRTVHPRGPSRAAFTLIEVMIVIAIIAVLASLGFAVFVKARGKAAQAQAQTDMAQLQQALASAKADLGNGDPTIVLPSSIVLHETINDYKTADQGSYNYLVRIFGKRAMDYTNKIDWNGDGTIDAAGSPGLSLQGHKALVFWLGGIPTAGGKGSLGFANNVTNPAASGGQRRGPYFDFKANRLVPDGNGFSHYIDPYSHTMPYAYFTCYAKGNDYQAGDCSAAKDANGKAPNPYNSTSSTFVNPNGFQILCAGSDGLWGAGGTTWNPTSGYPTGDPGYDDLANFGSGLLGTGQ